MKHRILLAITIGLILLLMISFSSCDDADESSEKTDLDLIYIERQDDFGAEGAIDYIEYYYHRTTKVVYMYVVNAQNSTGGLSPLYNADGTLMTYDTFLAN